MNVRYREELSEPERESKRTMCLGRHAHPQIDFAEALVRDPINRRQGTQQELLDQNGSVCTGQHEQWRIQ